MSCNNKWVPCNPETCKIKIEMLDRSLLSYFMSSVLTLTKKCVTRHDVGTCCDVINIFENRLCFVWVSNLTFRVKGKNTDQGCLRTGS
jgi:hypothetical protein